MKLNILRHIQGDKAIWIVALLLSLLSLLVVYSAAGSLAFRYRDGNTEYYLMHRLVILIFGFSVMAVAHKIKYTFFSKLAIIGVLLAIPLLLITLVSGSNINSASRWLTIPVLSISFQTSEFAKLALILYVARTLAVKQSIIKDFKAGFLPVAIPVCIICALILPANFSTAAMLFAICVLMMYIGRVATKHIAVLFGTAIAGFGLLFLTSLALPGLLPRLDTWTSRIETYTTQAESADKYQVENAKMAIAQGGLFGTGPGNNLNKYRLPQSYSDFIYAMIIGEYGFILGGIGILLLYLIFLYRCIRLASQSNMAIATFICIGLGLAVVFQAFVNMGVSVNLLPVTGQPLPMLSMGGTSTLFTFLIFGIILSISRSIYKQDTKEKTNTLLNNETAINNE